MTSFSDIMRANSIWEVTVNARTIIFTTCFQEKFGAAIVYTLFGFDLPSDKIGEDWAISAHPHGVSTVLNGEFKGKN